MSDNYTIEEVCGMINQYITEKAPRGAYKKQLYNYTKNEKDILDKIKKLEDIAKFNPHAAEKIHELRAKLPRVMSTPLPNAWDGKRTAYIDTAKVGAKGNKDGLKGDTYSYVKDIKRTFGQGEDPRSKLEKKPAGLYPTKKESANIIDTKLAIYESCDAGFITEDEKFELLSLLED